MTATQLVIPAALRARPQWVLWRAERGTKIPYTVHGTPASSTNPTTWTTFEAAWRAWSRGGFSGVGYVFAPDDEFVGVDLDDCRESDSGTIADWARALLDSLDSYTEVSPSGTGVKVWARGALTRAVKTANVEVYARARYFTVTGQRLEEYPAEPQDAQQAIDGIVARYGPKEPEPKAESRAPNAASNRKGAYAEVALRGECERVTMAGEGTRNNTLNAAAFNLGKLVAGGVLDEYDVMDALEHAAGLAGLAGHETRATIKSGMRAGMQYPREIPERPFAAGATMPRANDAGPIRQPNTQTRNAKHEQEDGLPILISARDLHRLPPAIPLIPDIIYVNRLHQIFGAPGSGKSYLALDIACTTAQLYPVIYIAAEAVEDYDTRIAAWEARHGVQVNNLYFWREPLMLGNLGDVDRFVTMAQAVGPALIIVDPLADCMTGLVESSQEGMSVAIFALNRIRRSTRAGVVIVHHTGWNDERERGSSILRGACRVVARVEQRDDGLIMLACVKKNQGAPFTPRNFRLVSSGEGMDVVPLPAARVIATAHKITDRMLRVMEALTTEPLRDGATHTDLQKDTGYSPATLNRVLTSLVEGGYVAAEDSGRSRVYSLSPTGEEALQDIQESEAEKWKKGPKNGGVLPQGSFNWFVLSSDSTGLPSAVLPCSSEVLPLESSPSSTLPPPYRVEEVEEPEEEPKEDTKTGTSTVAVGLVERLQNRAFTRLEDHHGEG